jgi:hypothetical protein
MAPAFSCVDVNAHDFIAVARMRPACGEIVCCWNRLSPVHIFGKSCPGVAGM